MKGLPAPKTAHIMERINALQAASPYYIDSTQLSDLCRELRLIKHEIDAMFKVDARAAWEATGAWYNLLGDWEGVCKAFKTSIDLGNSGSNYLNWVVNCANLGMFSAAHDAYRAAGAPEKSLFSTAVAIGFVCGAVEQAVRFAERAKEMKIPWNEGDREDLMEAHEILTKAGVSDERIARQLDVAGAVLRRHRIRPQIFPRVTSAEGFFSGVTYILAVPLSAADAFELNMELATEEYAAGIEKDVVFDVVFEGHTA
jgi:hypothetical protein